MECMAIFGFLFINFLGSELQYREIEGDSSDLEEGKI